jgi:hypothetical protein
MQRLIQAESSADLGESVDTTLADVDVLRAAGAACQKHHAAVDVWRAVVQHDKAAIKRVARVLHTQAVRLKSKKPDKDTAAVLGWLLDPNCPACKGRGQAPRLQGEEVVVGDCPACGGSGHRPVLLTGPAGALLAYTQAQQALAESLIAAKLQA